MYTDGVAVVGTCICIKIYKTYTRTQLRVSEFRSMLVYGYILHVFE